MLHREQTGQIPPTLPAQDPGTGLKRQSPKKVLLRFPLSETDFSSGFRYTLLPGSSVKHAFVTASAFMAVETTSLLSCVLRESWRTKLPSALFHQDRNCVLFLPLKIYFPRRSVAPGQLLYDLWWEDRKPTQWFWSHWKICIAWKVRAAVFPRARSLPLKRQFRFQIYITYWFMEKQGLAFNLWKTKVKNSGIFVSRAIVAALFKSSFL